MKELFNEYGMLICDAIGAAIGIGILYMLFVGPSSALANVVQNMMEMLL